MRPESSIGDGTPGPRTASDHGHSDCGGLGRGHAPPGAGGLVAAASLFVDRRESTVNESGDYLAAVEHGAVIRAELGELLTGTAEGRKSESEITLFKSLGLAVEDLAAAAFLYDAAREKGRGTWVEFSAE